MTPMRWGSLRLALATGLGAVAFRPLLGLGSIEDVHSVAADADRWLFETEALSPLPVIALAGWLLWRRLRALPPSAKRPEAPTAAGALAAVGVALFTWAWRAPAADLLLPALSAFLLGHAAWTHGRAGARQLALPALVLLAAVSIPAPVENELLWWLQILTTWSSVSLLHLVGYDVFGSGIVIHFEERTFLVIEECSGLRGMQILTLVALLVRELHRAGGVRMWWVVAAAPLVGFAANAIRAAVVAATAPSAAPGVPVAQDHTLQGLAVLAGGTVVLYGLGHLLERSHAQLPAHADAGRVAPAPGWLPTAWLAALALLSFLPARAPSQSPSPPIAFPRQHGGWRGEDVPVDRLFLGALPLGPTLARRYVESDASPPGEPVYVFIARSAAREQRATLRSSKLLVPGPEWAPTGDAVTRLWSLGRDVWRGTAATPTERSLSYLWRARREGLIEESLRSLLALPRAAPDVVVRLTTRHRRSGEVARDRARRRLERFAGAFREELLTLDRPGEG